MPMRLALRWKTTEGYEGSFFPEKKFSSYNFMSRLVTMVVGLYCFPLPEGKSPRVSILTTTMVELSSCLGE